MEIDMALVEALEAGIIHLETRIKDTKALIEACKQPPVIEDVLLLFVEELANDQFKLGEAKMQLAHLMGED